MLPAAPPVPEFDRSPKPSSSREPRDITGSAPFHDSRIPESMDDHTEDLQPASESQLKEIHDSAAVVAESCRTNLGVDIELNAESIRWLDGYINRLRTGGFGENEFRKLAQGFGSLLGEALIAVYGGSWVRTDTGFGVLLKGLGVEYPFHRVVKQIECGADESVYRHFAKISEIGNQE